MSFSSYCIQSETVLLEIRTNLDRREIERLYTSQGFQYRPSTADLVESQFFDRVEKESVKRRRLGKVTRIKVGAKEYITYDLTYIAEDRIGNELTFNKTEGKHEEPKFTHQWDNEERRNVATSLVGKTTIYEIPFSKQKMQEIYNLHTEPEATTSFLLIVGANARYSGFTADEFLNKTFDELLTKATTGEYPEEEEEKTTTIQSQPRPARVEEHYDKETGLPKGEDRYLKEITKGVVAETEAGSQEEKDYEKMGQKIEEQMVVVKEVEDPDEALKGLKKPSSKKSPKRKMV